MPTYITIIDYIIVLLFVLGLGLQVSKTYAEIQYQRKVEGTLFRSIRKVSNEPFTSYNGVGYSITVTIAVLWALEHYGLDLSFKLILIATILHVAIGTTLTIVEVILRLLNR